MSIRSAIYSRIGGLSASAYPGIIPQGSNAASAIVYNVITGSRMRGLCGDQSMINTRVQVDCYATTLLGAETLMVEVQAAMTTDGADFKVSEITDNGDSYDVDSDLYRLSADFSLWHSGEL